MPTRKQRRRASKTFRHEYDTVSLDADGNERPVDEDELRSEREARPKAKSARAGRSPRGEEQRPRRAVADAS